jgi:hypothetical protein
MFRKITKKHVLLAAAITALACSAIAFGFFSSTGSGSGTGSVSNPSTSGAITVHGTVAGALVPGGSQTVSFTADNSSSSSLRLGTIHLVSVSADAQHSGCTSSVGQFSMSDVTANEDVASGNGHALNATGTLSMGSSGNQDACKGASLTLTFSTT